MLSMWRSCSELVYYCKTGWQDCFDSVVTFKTCHSPSGLLVKTQFFTTEAKGWVQEWHPYLNNVLVLDQSNWPVFAALHLCGVFLGKNSSLGARKDWRIVFFLWVFTWCVRGFWLPQGYVEKIVWAWNGTPVTLVLTIKHLCGGFLCERNSSLSKWGDQ